MSGQRDFQMPDFSSCVWGERTQWTTAVLVPTLLNTMYGFPIRLWPRLAHGPPAVGTGGPPFSGALYRVLSRGRRRFTCWPTTWGHPPGSDRRRSRDRDGVEPRDSARGTTGKSARSPDGGGRGSAVVQALLLGCLDPPPADEFATGDQQGRRTTFPRPRGRIPHRRRAELGVPIPNHQPGAHRAICTSRPGSASAGLPISVKNTTARPRQ